MQTRRTPQILSDAKAMQVPRTLVRNSEYSICLEIASKHGNICFLILKRAPSINVLKLVFKKIMHSFFVKQSAVANFSINMSTAIFALSIQSDFLVRSCTTLNTRKIASSFGKYSSLILNRACTPSLYTQSSLVIKIWEINGKILTVSKSRASQSEGLAGDFMSFLKTWGNCLNSSIFKYSCSSAAYTSSTGKMNATVSLKVNILRIFSRSHTKCSLSAKEYFFDLGFPSLTRPFNSDYFGVSYSPSISSDPSESLKGSSIISASYSAVKGSIQPSPRSSLALAIIASFSSSLFSDLVAAPLFSSS